MEGHEVSPGVVRLRGSSWDHPRGHAPMVATAAAYESEHGGDVSIAWVARTLKEFGMVSVEELARQFDLIVMDHPHIGTMAESGCVVALDRYLDTDLLAALALNSPGRSHQSYRYDAHQWALAIDAACQTSAWRPDLLARAPATWSEVLTLALSGRVLWPLCAVDAAASFMSLTMAQGEECAATRERFVGRDAGRWALQTMYDVAARSDPICLDSNPIHVLEALAHSDDYVYSPLAFCYVNYSRHDHTGHKVSFGDIPSASAGTTPCGALLGGAGLAISAFSENIAEALAYAQYVASGDVQRGLYYSSGGQPAHRAPWSDADLDVTSGGFFSGVAPVLEHSWTRPNGPRFAAFQNSMIDHFDEWFGAATAPDVFLDELDDLYRSSLRDVEAPSS
ncbi:MAG TPA: extracellular solute-binding protein [Acidimicrobiales bacterium]